MRCRLRRAHRRHNSPGSCLGSPDVRLKIGDNGHMGLFGPKRIQGRRGVWTTIISNAFVQMPVVFDVRIVTADGSPVDGLYEEKKSLWIFPGTPLQGRLAPVMAFERGYFNTFFSVKVCPTADCIIEVH